MYCATSPTSTYLSSLFLELKLHTTYIQATTKKKYTSSALEVLYNYFFFRHIFVDLKQNACIRWINLRDFFFTLIPSSKTCKSLLCITSLQALLKKKILQKDTQTDGRTHRRCCSNSCLDEKHPGTS